MNLDLPLQENQATTLQELELVETLTRWQVLLEHHRLTREPVAALIRDVL